MKRKFPFGSASSDDVPEPQGQGLLSSILKSLNSLPTNVFTTRLEQQTQDVDVDDEEDDEYVEKEISDPKPIIKNPLGHLAHVTKPADYKMSGKAALHASELFSIQKKIEKLSLLKMSEEYINNEMTETELSPSNKSVSKFSEKEAVLEETMMNIESESEPPLQEEEQQPSIVSSVLASAASKQSFQKFQSEEKTKSPVPLPVVEKINVEKREWTDQEIEVFLEVASKLTRSVTKKENRGNIHEKVNAELKKKGIDTELQIYDVMQRLNEDLIKIKRRIAYKNEKYKHFNSYLALDDIKNDDDEE